MRLPLIDMVHFRRLDPRNFKRFEFGPDESYLLGRIIRECGPEIVRNREFAIPPFRQTYIELDSRRLYDGIGAGVHGSFDASDTRLGFACDDLYGVGHEIIFTLCEGPSLQKKGVAAGAGVFYYWRLSPDTVERKRFEWTTEDGAPSAALMLGSDSEKLDPEEHRQLVKEWGVHSIHADDHPDLGRQLAEEWRHSAGELRVAWAALLLINRPTKLVRQVSVPHATGLHKGKRRVYAAHTKVVLGEERKAPLLRQLGLSERGAPRRHEVRGHFVHYGLGAGCEHDWEPTSIKPIKRWACTKCKGRRVWRHEFERGDASKGYATKDYLAGANLTMEVVT